VAKGSRCTGDFANVTSRKTEEVLGHAPDFAGAMPPQVKILTKF
jgi:hypothetical protein